jgi:tetratricopeptide (TPR) repeat protein
MAGTPPNRFFARVMADQQYEKGRELESAGFWERALAAYRRASSLDASNVLYLVARGRVCHAHGLEPEAEECYAVALRLRPNDTVALYNQAQLFAARGQLDAARTNLDRIVSGDGELLGERAAPVYCKLGDIALRREEYAIAELHYRKALAVAPTAPTHRYATAALGALARLAEFPAPVQPDGRLDPKVAVYAYAGAIALGMPDDDGIALPLLPALGFDSLEEVAATLARVVRLARHLRWVTDAVCALDAESQPLAIALAAVLDARVFGPTEDGTVPHGAACLAVSATGDDPTELARRIAVLRERCEGVRFYAVGLRHPVWEYIAPPTLVSVPVRLEFPWNRGEASTAEHAEAFGEELALRLRAALETDDGTTEAQLVWYARHARLNHSPASALPLLLER